VREPHAREHRGQGHPFGSPVWSGSYLTSHRVAVNRVDTSSNHLHGHDLTQTEAEALLSQYPLDAMSILRQQRFKIGDTISISNNSKQGQSWSHDGGSSGQYAEVLQTRPSPWHKTRGDMYKNAADFALMYLKESSAARIFTMVNSSNKAAAPAKVEVRV